MWKLLILPRSHIIVPRYRHRLRLTPRLVTLWSHPTHPQRVTPCRARAEQWNRGRARRRLWYILVIFFDHRVPRRFMRTNERLGEAGRHLITYGMPYNSRVTASWCCYWFRCNWWKRSKTACNLDQKFRRLQAVDKNFLVTIICLKMGFDELVYLGYPFQFGISVGSSR